MPTRPARPRAVSHRVAAVLALLLAPASAQTTYLKASNTGFDDDFGTAVAMDGDLLAVGAPGERSGATLVDGDQTDDSVFAAGAVYVFARHDGAWQQEAYLKAAITYPYGAFGTAVALSGDRLAVGAPRDDTQVSEAGAVYVFARHDGTWSLEATLFPDNLSGSDFFGSAVALSGDRLVVSSPSEDSATTGVDGDGSDDDAFTAGAAYVFERLDGSWVQTAYLKASNTGPGDIFGRSVAISDRTVVVGAPHEDSGATGVDGDQTDDSTNAAGAAYVYIDTPTGWVQQAYLKASNTAVGDQFGQTVAIAGHRIVVGAWREDGASPGVDGDQTVGGLSNAGAVYVFEREGTTWSQTAYLKASNPGGLDEFGSALAIAGNVIAVAAIQEDGYALGTNGDQNDLAVQSGAAYVFVRHEGTWCQHAYVKATNTQKFDAFGSAVALSGNELVVGAFQEDSSATGIDGDQEDEGAGEAGAAYRFALEDVAWSDLGGGSGPSAPRLTGSGTPCAGHEVGLALDDAPADALLVAWLSLAPTPFPALGGTVHAHPFAAQFLFATDGAGAFAVTSPWPAGVPSGTQVAFQCIVEDPTGAAGLTLSNGVRCSTP